VLAAISGVSEAAVVGDDLSRVEINARQIRGMPRPTTNHCTALDFFGGLAGLGL